MSISPFKKKKIAFYSCFYGSTNNSSFKIPFLPSRNHDCYFYTNNPEMIKSLDGTGWIAILDDIPVSDDIIISCMQAKKVKVLPNEYKELRKYEFTCFLDSKLKRVSEKFVEDYIDRYFINANYALLLRKHWFIRNNIWNEYNESMHQQRYSIHKSNYEAYINSQINNGLSDTIENHCACGFLIRNMNHPKINHINREWYKHIQECGIQDQISFFFVQQLFTGYILQFSEIPFK